MSSSHLFLVFLVVVLTSVSTYIPFLPFSLLAFDVNGQTSLIFVLLCDLLYSYVLLIHLIHRLFWFSMYHLFLLWDTLPITNGIYWPVWDRIPASTMRGRRLTAWGMDQPRWAFSGKCMKTDLIMLIPCIIDNTHNTKPTKYAHLFLRYLHYNITRHVSTCFGPQRTIIKESNEGTQHKTKLVTLVHRLRGVKESVKM